MTMQQQRIYGAARIDYQDPQWNASNSSADAEIYSSLVRLRSLAWQEYQDMEWIRRGVDSIIDEVIGTGVPMKPTVRRSARGVRRGGSPMDERSNELIHQAWCYFTKKTRFSATGKESATQAARVLLRSVLVGGEGIARLVPMAFGDSRVQMGIELIEPALLDETKNDIQTDGSIWVMGVLLDKWGRPRKYSFRSRQRLDVFSSMQGTYGPNIEIDASEIIHLFVGERARQTRGITSLSTVIKRARNLNEYSMNELIRQRATSSMNGFLTWDQDADIPQETLARINAQREWDMTSNSWRELPPGQTPVPPPMSTADPTYAAYMRQGGQTVASGMGASVESMTSDFTATNWSRSKIAQVMRQPFVQNLQQFMCEDWYQTVYDAWLPAAVAAGLPLPGFAMAPERFYQVKWCPPQPPMLDPPKELKAKADAVASMIYTLGDVLVQLHPGRTIEEHLDMIQHERQEMEQRGLPLPGSAPAPAESPPEEGNGDEQQDGEDAGEVEAAGEE